MAIQTAIENLTVVIEQATTLGNIEKLELKDFLGRIQSFLNTKNSYMTVLRKIVVEHIDWVLHTTLLSVGISLACRLCL